MAFLRAHFGPSYRPVEMPKINGDDPFIAELNKTAAARILDDWIKGPGFISCGPQDADAIKESFTDVRYSGPPFVTLSQGEYQDLRAMAHRCLFHQVLKVGLPIIPRDDYSYDQWAFLTPPDRLEVSMEIWESIRALKSPLEWHEFEDALGSTRK